MATIKGHWELSGYRQYNLTQHKLHLASLNILLPFLLTFPSGTFITLKSSLSPLNLTIISSETNSFTII